MKILVLDIETTGFLKQGGSIIEVGIVELDLSNGEIKEVYNSLCHEDILTDRHKSKPFGWIFDNSDLTFSQLKTARPANQVFVDVQSILYQNPNGCTAYNKAFDFGFLRDRGLIIKDLPCPMLLATDICELPGKFGGYKRPKVEEAFAHLFPGVDYTEKHRGADDARHEAMIVYKLYTMGIFIVNQS